MNNTGLGRGFMKCPRFGDLMSASDQSLGIPNPPHGKPVVGEVVQLPPFDTAAAIPVYADILDARRSRRLYAHEPITQEQLAFVLWSMQGVQGYRADNRVAVLRPVPSGGARHPFELYAAIRDVSGLKPGLYRFAPLLNIGEKVVSLEYLKALEDYEVQITRMLSGQGFAAKAAAVMFLSCVPYRAEWRYVEAAHRVMLMDIGHIGQNAMLSATALGLGSCCFGAYDQDFCDEILELDGKDEYTVYAVSIGVAASE